MAKKKTSKKGTPLGSIKLLEESIESLQKRRCSDLEDIYKNLASLKLLVDNAVERLVNIDQSKGLADAAFNAGIAYADINKASDKLYEMLEGIYDTNDFDHWDDVLNND